MAEKGVKKKRIVKTDVMRVRTDTKEIFVVVTKIHNCTFAHTTRLGSRNQSQTHQHYTLELCFNLPHTLYPVTHTRAHTDLYLSYKFKQQ